MCEFPADGLDPRVHTEHLFNVSCYPKGFDELSPLQSCEERYERLQVADIRSFECVDVLTAFDVSNNQRQPIRFDEYQRGKRPGDSPVTVLEWVNLNEPVM